MTIDLPLAASTIANRILWSTQEDALISQMYGDDAIDSPLSALVEKLPHRSYPAIAVRANVLGVAAARRERRLAAGLRVGPPRGMRRVGERVRGPRFPLARVPNSTAPRLRGVARTPAVRYRAGACDRGDRELVRRRITGCFGLLCQEIGRSMAAVVAAVDVIARDGYVEQSAERASVKPGTLRPGPCDSRDRETIRRAVLGYVGSLSAEICRSPVAIMQVLDDLAKAKYEVSSPLGGPIERRSAGRTVKGSSTLRRIAGRA